MTVKAARRIQHQNHVSNPLAQQASTLISINRAPYHPIRALASENEQVFAVWAVAAVSACFWPM
jgi:hypothetical protein